MFNLKIPQSIFVHADGFLKTTDKLSGDPPDPLCMVALVTNSAFAAELYLKCLIHLETGQLMKSEHNLRKLFSKLSDKAQVSIQERYDGEIKMPEYDLPDTPENARAIQAANTRPRSLREALKVGGDAFIDWRYLYETDGDANHFALFSLPRFIREEILKLKPEWAQFRIKMTKMADARPTSPAPKSPEPSDTPQ